MSRKVQPEDNAFSQALNSGAKAKRAELNALDGVAFDPVVRAG